MILLDTHAAAWLALKPQRLSKAATTAIRRAGSEGIAIASVTLMELSQLLSKERFQKSGVVQTIW